MEVIKEFRGDYRFLSNFWPCRVYLDGIPYRSTEHAYQAAKYSEHKARLIFNAEKTTAGKAKKLGRLGDLELSDARRYEIMRNLNYQKYCLEENAAIKELLMATEDAWLEEGNLWGDTFWGVDLDTGKGDNRLGKLLMEIREAIRQKDLTLINAELFKCGAALLKGI